MTNQQAPIKFCNNCQHGKAIIFNDDASYQCNAPENSSGISVITGRPISTKPAVEVRNDPEMCGMEAKWYVSYPTYTQYIGLGGSLTSELADRKIKAKGIKSLGLEDI